MNILLKYLRQTTFKCTILTWLATIIFLPSCIQDTAKEEVMREVISLNDNWRFFRYEDAAETDTLIYDHLPEITKAGE